MERFTALRWLVYSTAALLAPVMLVGFVLWEITVVSLVRHLYRRRNVGRTLAFRVGPSELTLDGARRRWKTAQVVLLTIDPSPRQGMQTHQVVALQSDEQQHVVVFAAVGDRAAQFSQAVSGALDVPLATHTVKGPRQPRRDRYTRTSL